MTEYPIDSPSGKNLTSRRLETEVPANKKTGPLPAQDLSFKKILEGAVDRGAGSSEIRRELVDKYKLSLANGTYEVKAHELAEKMIQKISEGKTRRPL